MNTDKPTQTLSELVLSILDEMKARDVIVKHIGKMTDIASEMIICSATSTRHASAMAEKIVTESKHAGNQPLGVEGEDTGEWVLIDLGDIIIHIMLPETREFYSLEKLWSRAEESRNNNES